MSCWLHSMLRSCSMTKARYQQTQTPARRSVRIQHRTMYFCRAFDISFCPVKCRGWNNSKEHRTTAYYLTTTLIITRHLNTCWMETMISQRSQTKELYSRHPTSVFGQNELVGYMACWGVALYDQSKKSSNSTAHGGMCAFNLEQCIFVVLAIIHLAQWKCRGWNLYKEHRTTAYYLTTTLIPRHLNTCWTETMILLRSQTKEIYSWHPTFVLGQNELVDYMACWGVALYGPKQDIILLNRAPNVRIWPRAMYICRACHNSSCPMKMTRMVPI
jgi:hypothetical protein